MNDILKVSSMHLHDPKGSLKNDLLLWYISFFPRKHK